MEKIDLVELYNHRFSAGFSIIYSTLSEEAKNEFNQIAAEEHVKKWREDGTLIGRICRFSSDEKEKYLPFIDFSELYDADFQYWIIKRIVDCKLKKIQQEQLKTALQKLSSEQKSRAVSFLELEEKDSNNEKYKAEIELIISLLKASI